MKVKTTRKAIVNGSYNVKCAGYCDLSYLLNNHSPHCVHLRRVWLEF